MPTQMKCGVNITLHAQILESACAIETQNTKDGDSDCLTAFSLFVSLFRTLAPYANDHAYVSKRGMVSIRTT